MYRYFVQIRFLGSAYHGWQRQTNSITIQEVIESTLSTILRIPLTVVGAGRTDTGVHASFFIFHFDFPEILSDAQNLIRQLNSFLPNDIAVQKIIRVDPVAHARFSAISRTYRYYISTIKDPFKLKTAYYYRGALNIEKMNTAAQYLFKYNDFTSFSRLHSDTKTNLCKIYDALWENKGDDQIIFTIRADRFLRNMVRAITGTLLDVGRGKISCNDFTKIIEKRDRSAAGASAPAQGLFLTKIEYPDSINLSD